MELPRPNGLVALLTDFGVDEPWAGVLRAVVKRHNVKADVIDLCHGVPAHDVGTGAFYLAAAVAHFPPGTVVVAVVDPGVGTLRRALAACAAGCFWLGPDNGVLEPILRREDLELREIDVEKLRLPAPSRTFHGRDVFAPVAGMLSSGRFGFRALGNKVRDPIRLESAPFAADAPPRVAHVDRFGNLITNVSAARMAAERWVGVRIAGVDVPRGLAYADAQPGAAIALIDSYDLLEIAVCRGRAVDVLGAPVGTPIEPVFAR